MNIERAVAEIRKTLEALRHTAYAEGYAAGAGDAAEQRRRADFLKACAIGPRAIEGIGIGVGPTLGVSYLSKEDMEKANEVETPWGIFDRHARFYKAT